MSDALFASIERIARHEAQARAVAAVGLVTAVHSSPGLPADHAVTVQLRDSGLICPRVPVAVGVLGFAATPAVDDLVVVLFLDGDVNAPVVVGRLYHADHEPPDHGDGEIVLRLPSGETPKLDLVVRGDAPEVDLKLPGDVRVLVAEDRVLLEAGRVKVEVDGGGRAEVAAGGSKCVLKEDGDVDVSATGNLTLKGINVSIKADAQVEISGSAVKLN